MGNYKSRPTISCADELKNKISESYAVLRSKLIEDLRTRDVEWTDFQQACSRSDVLKVVELASSDNVNDKDHAGLTPLHLCCITGGSKDHVRCLLQKGGDANTLSRNGFSPLHIACYKGDVELICALLDGGGNVQHFGYHEVAGLHIASMCGHEEGVELLISRQSDVNSQDVVKFSPLHIACYFGHEKVVETLIKDGAEIDLAGSVDDKPLHLSASKGYLKITQLLVEGIGDNRADVNCVDKEQHTPLHFACKGGYLAIITYLLQHDADHRLTNIYGDTPLHLACYHGKLEAVKTLISQTGDTCLNMENIFSETPLHSACTYGRSVDLVKYLLEQDAVDMNYQGMDGHTALHSACYHGHSWIVQLLLDHGVDMNLIALSSDQNGGSEKKEEQTCLMWAYERGHDAIVTLLKHYKRPQDESACGDYSQPGSEGSYVSVPSPLGKLRSMTREKIDVLHLRANIPHNLQVLFTDIELMEPIGSGSFGCVHKGKFRGKICAVKRYRASTFGAKSDVDMFCREVSILSQLHSSYVIKFVAAVLDDPSQFAIITEFVSGGSLFSILHEQKRLIDLHSKLTISLDVAKGMDYLHTLPQPIIHRDLNSHNILLTENGHAVVADFGESRFLSSREGMVQDDNMTKQPGNLRWMAPEIFTQCTKYSIKADMFSYALCIWELLAGELPFAHLKPAAAAAEMAYRNTRPPIAITFPKPIISLLQKAWHANPEDRPEFSSSIPILEMCKESQAVAMLSNSAQMETFTISTSHCAPEEDEEEDDGRSTPPLAGHVSAMRTRWELEASKNSGVPVDELRRRIPYLQLDKNGYVSDPLSTLRMPLMPSGSIPEPPPLPSSPTSLNLAVSELLQEKTKFPEEK
ncbi:unnamed protein product [Owenia fusiformis]|uniref:Uncharacterized protein n=1 Tax=Owenia fusiformis TaxID=6347 RepID=A0A8J1U1K9_OWEFU|nr:unnamed protein product [Owenia fusiformis]